MAAAMAKMAEPAMSLIVMREGKYMGGYPSPTTIGVSGFDLLTISGSWRCGADNENTGFHTSVSAIWAEPGRPNRNGLSDLHALPVRNRHNLKVLALAGTAPINRKNGQTRCQIPR